MANHGKNSYISIAQAEYNFLNPLNSQGGKKELKEAKKQAGKARGAGASAVKQIPGPWDMLMDLIGKGVAAFVNFVLNVVDGIIWSLFALPAPGQAFDPGTWYTPGTPPLSNSSSNISNMSAAANNSSNATANITAIQPMAKGGGVDHSVLPAGLDFDAWWSVVWKVYAGLASLATIVLIATGIFGFSSSSPTPRERNQRLRDVGIALALVLFGPIVLPMSLHFGNILAAGLAPNASELLNSPGDLMKIGDSIGFALIGAYFASTLMAIGLLLSVLVAFAQWLLTFFVASTWVVWAALYGSQNATLKAWSRVGFATLGILVALKIFQALLFRIVWLLPLSWSDPAESVITLLVFPIALYLIFYKLPKYATKKAIPAFVTTVGSGGSGGGGKRFSYANNTQNIVIAAIDPGTNNPGPSGNGNNNNNNNYPSGPPGAGGAAVAIPASEGDTDSGSETDASSESKAGSSTDRTRTRGSGNDSGDDKIIVQDVSNNPDPGGDGTSNDGDPSELPDDGDTPTLPAGGESGGNGSETGNSITPRRTRTPSDEQLGEILDGRESSARSTQTTERYDELPSDVRERVASSGGSTETGQRTRSRDGAPTDDDTNRTEIVHEVENRNEPVEKTDSAREEIPSEIHENVTRMEGSAPEPREEASSPQRTRTRKEGSEDPDVVEVVHDIENRPTEDSGTHKMPTAVNDFFTSDERGNDESSTSSSSQSTGGGRTRSRSRSGSDSDGASGQDDGSSGSGGEGSE